VRLTRDFYARPTLDVARDLIGKVLVHNRRGVRTSGIIVKSKPTSANPIRLPRRAGATRRNAPLYGPPGFAYVLSQLRHPSAR